jgi:copper chaperone NosL
MKSKPRKAVHLLIGTLLLIACCSSSREPVDLFADDMCSFCKMAISQKQFAAEIITATDEVFKFDDIGCMFSFIKSRNIKTETSTLYVMDFQTGNWIAAEKANFIASRDIETPMGGGVIAFKEKEAVQQYNGRLLTYAQLLQEKRHE